MDPFLPVTTLSLWPEPTSGVMRNDMGIFLFILASLSSCETESTLIMTPWSVTAFISASLTLTPVYIMSSGGIPAFNAVMTSPMETASMPLPSCASTDSMARLVFALQA